MAKPAVAPKIPTSEIRPPPPPAEETVKAIIAPRETVLPKAPPAPPPEPHKPDTSLHDARVAHDKAKEEERLNIEKLTDKPPRMVAEVLQFAAQNGIALAINVESKSGWYKNQRSGGIEIKRIGLTFEPDGVVVIWKGIRNNSPGERPEPGTPHPTAELYRTWFPASLVKDLKLLED